VRRRNAQTIASVEKVLGEIVQSRFWEQNNENVHKTTILKQQPATSNQQILLIVLMFERFTVSFTIKFRGMHNVNSGSRHKDGGSNEWGNK